MNSKIRARSALALPAVLGLVLLAPPSAAQVDLQGTSDWVPPAPTGAGQFERTDHGDFDGDGVADMVVQRGTTLEVLLAPGLYDQPLVVPTPVSAYAVCPVAPTTTQGLLMVATAAGLEQLRLEPDQGSWSHHLVAPGWAGATLLEVHDMGGTVAVLGVLADQRTVRCAFRLNGEWFEQPMLVHPEPIRDLTVFEFDGSGQVEISVAGDSALTVYDALGVLRQAFPVGDATSVAIGRLDLPKSARDGLAWIVTRTEGVQQLIVLAPDGIQPPQHVVTLPLVVDLETGDIDGDGDSDIVLSHIVDHTLPVLLDMGNGWTPEFVTKGTYGTRTLHFGPDGVPASHNTARPNLTDLDGDGDNDLLMPVQSSGDLFVWCSDTVDQESYEPEVDLTDPEAASSLEALGNGDLAMNLELSIDLPEDATATHIEVVVWRRPSPDEPTEPMAVQRVLLPIDGNEPQTLSATVLLPQVPDIIPGTNVRFDSMYFWLQRAVRVYNGAVSHRWPARVYALETSPEPENYSYIKSLGGSMMYPVYECQNGASLPDLIGCGSELPKLPEFPGGKVPTWM